MGSMADLLRHFKVDNKNYPIAQDALEVIIDNQQEKYPIDAWGMKIQYVQKGEDFILISYGADRRAGGRGEAEDIIYPDCVKN